MSPLGVTIKADDINRRARKLVEAEFHFTYSKVDNFVCCILLREFYNVRMVFVDGENIKGLGSALYSGETGD
jgi:hypothetical protein